MVVSVLFQKHILTIILWMSFSSDLVIEEILHCLMASLSPLCDGDGIVSREDGDRLMRPLSSSCEVGFRGESNMVFIGYGWQNCSFASNPDRGFVHVLSELQDRRFTIPAAWLLLLPGFDNRSTDFLFMR